MINRLQTFTIACIFFISGFLCSSVTQADGAQIAIIKSQELVSYQRALEGIRSVYQGKIREFDLKGDAVESERIMRELKRNPPDVILSIGLLAAVVARDNFQHTPIVYCMVLNPYRFSLYGNNLTGVTMDNPPSETFPRLRDIFPSAKRIGVLYDPVKTGRTVEREMQLARSWGFTLITQEVSSAKELPDAFRAIQREIDLLWLIPDSTVVTPESMNFIFLESFEKNIPIITFSRELLSRGAVLAFSPDHYSVGEEAGRRVNQILQGKNPSDLPIGPVKKIHTYINMLVAKKMGIEINPTVLYSMKDQIEFFTPAKTASTDYPDE